MSRKEGITEGKLRALKNFESADVYTELEKLCIRYAVAMTNTPVDVPDALFDQLRAHFNEQQLVELTSALAWENYRARFNHALHIGAAGFSEGAFCPVPERTTEKVAGQ